MIRWLMFVQVPGRTRPSVALLQGLLKAGANPSLNRDASELGTNKGDPSPSKAWHRNYIVRSEMKGR